MKEKESCEARIEKELESRLHDLLPEVHTWTKKKCLEYLKQEGLEPTGEDLENLRSEAQEIVTQRAGEMVLSVDKLLIFKICLSFGGPADYFELSFNPESKEWVTGTYIFQDWFDGAERPIDADTTERLAELFGIYPEA